MEAEMKLGEMETKFAELIWKMEPIPSGSLVKICESEFNWKKSTTYTMLKRLCNKNLFQNNNGTVTSVITQEEYYAVQSREFVNTSFGGSLPKLFVAFTSKNKLSKAEIDELQRMIDEYKEDTL